MKNKQIRGVMKEYWKEMYPGKPVPEDIEKYLGTEFNNWMTINLMLEIKSLTDQLKFQNCPHKEEDLEIIESYEYIVVVCMACHKFICHKQREKKQEKKEKKENE